MKNFFLYQKEADKQTEYEQLRVESRNTKSNDKNC